MIDPEVQKTVYNLHNKGRSISKISNSLSIDRRTVRNIIECNGEFSSFKKREDAIHIDEELLKETFVACSGWAQRIHEVLAEKGVVIGYSTLTRKIQKMGLRNKDKKRSSRVPDEPGLEFQHDTSPYTIKINGNDKKVQASQMYYRYSKVRYLKFYNSFTRFYMKCFFTEALSYFKYVPKECIIDNTNLAVLCGTGENAIFNNEMISFSKIFDFKWKAHAIMHSDRKAGVERSFWTVETNFFPGRSFTSFEDLNRQAFEWSEKHAITPNKKTKIIPIEVFETEKILLKKVMPDLPSPYIVHGRVVDQYGYIAFDSNYYWIPLGTNKEVKVLQFEKVIKIYNDRKLAVEYSLPAFGVRSEKFSPKDVHLRHAPKKVSIPPYKEEEVLRSLGEDVNKYLDGIIKGTSTNRKYQSIKRLHSLHCRFTPSLFLKSIVRSLKYNVYDVSRLEEISIQILKSENLEIPDPVINYDYEGRENYKEGEFTDCVDLSTYEDKYGGKNGNEH